MKILTRIFSMPAYKAMRKCPKPSMSISKESIKFNEVPTSIIAEKYGFTHLKIVEKAGGLSAENYFALVDNAQQIVIKKYKNKTDEQIKKIEYVINTVKSLDISVPLFIKNIENKTYTYINNNYYALYHKAYGKVLHGSELDQRALTSVAENLAKLHKIKSKLELKTTTDILPLYHDVHDQALIVENLIAQNTKGREIDNIARKLISLKLDILSNFVRQAEFKEQLLSPHNLVLVHGDFHNENLLFNDEHKLVIMLDFEESHYGHATEDILHFMQLACFNSGYCKSNIDIAKFFLKQYIAHNIISSRHIELGGHLYLYRIASSFFLEKKLFTSGCEELAHFLQRDLKNLEYLRDHVDELVANLLDFTPNTL